MINEILRRTPLTPHRQFIIKNFPLLKVNYVLIGLHWILTTCCALFDLLIVSVCSPWCFYKDLTIQELGRSQITEALPYLDRFLFLKQSLLKIAESLRSICLLKIYEGIGVGGSDTGTVLSWHL